MSISSIESAGIYGLDTFNATFDDNIRSCVQAVPWIKLKLAENMTTNFTVILNLQDQADDVMVSVVLHYSNDYPDKCMSKIFYKLCTKSSYDEVDAVNYYICPTSLSDNQPVEDLLITFSPPNTVGLCEVAVIP